MLDVGRRCGWSSSSSADNHTVQQAEVQVHKLSICKSTVYVCQIAKQHYVVEKMRGIGVAAPPCVYQAAFIRVPACPHQATWLLPC